MERKRPSPCFTRVAEYDWVRLIATVLVVLGHSAYLEASSAYGGVAYGLPANVSPVYLSRVFSVVRFLSGWVYKFHIPLFFMLSGAVFALGAEPSFDQLCRKKAKRLLLPYFVWGWGFMLPLKRIGNYYTAETFATALRVFLMGEESGHLWYLTALMWCMLLFLILKKALNRLGIHSGYLLLILVRVVQLLLGNYVKYNVLDFQMGVEYLLYFAIGYQFELERRKHPTLKKSTVIIGLLLLILLEIADKKWSILEALPGILAGSALCYLLAYAAKFLFPGVSRSKAWQRLIPNLFYVYIFHDPLNYLILKVTEKYQWLTTGWGCWVYLLSRTVLVFVVSLLLGSLVTAIKNRLPGQKNEPRPAIS